MGCARVSSGSDNASPTRASPRSIPSQTMLGESALQSLAGQCLKCLVDLGASAPPPCAKSGLPPPPPPRTLEAPRTRSPALMPCLRAASLVATATMGLPSSFMPARATTTGASSPSWPRTSSTVLRSASKEPKCPTFFLATLTGARKLWPQPPALAQRPQAGTRTLRQDDGRIP